MKIFSLVSTLVILMLLLSNIAFSQGVAINNDGTSANSSAMLDVKSTNSGILVPRMTQAERNLIGGPATGLLIFQTDNTPGFYYNAGTSGSPSWIRLSIPTDNFDDSDADATNELQTLSIAGHDITLSDGGGTVTVPDNNTTYSAGNQLGLSGTTFNVSEGSGSGLDGDMVDGQHYSDIQTWVNSNDDNTTYSAGTGLTLTGTVFTPTFGTAVGTVSQGNHTHDASHIITGEFDRARVRRMTSADTRATNPNPDTYEAALQTDFKSNATDGLSDGGTYHGVFSYRPYGSTTDFSGGPMHQLGFTQNGNLWQRTSTGTTTWSAWKKLLSSSDIGTISGTTNYVSKFTSANALGNSQIFDNGTNVGISRADPAQKLDVVGRVRSSDPSYTTSRWIDIYSSSAQIIETTNDLYIGTTGASAIHLQPGRVGASNSYVHIRDNAGTNWATFDAVNTNRSLTFNGACLDINRDGFPKSGISWYSQSYPSWSTYMAPTGSNMGPHGDLTAPSGTYVTSWAHRSYVENSAGYGWTFESAPNTTTPAVKFEIRSSDGLFHSYGSGFIDGNLTVNGSIYGVKYADISNIPVRTSWVGVHRGFVAEQLSWKNYGNNHTIFDASQSTSPDGTAVDNTNSQVAWSATYPTLMGWNGANTYGLRVDAARVSDNTTGNSATVGGLSAGSFMQYQGFTLDANTMTANRSGFTYSVNSPFTGPIVHFDAANYGLQINSAYSSSGIGYRTRNGDNGTWNTWREFITTANIGSYGDNLGNHTATTTLNMNYNDITHVNDILCDQNYGRGLVGVYSSTVYQNVFAMGSAYRLTANGSTPGNMYGLAWTHTNVGGESKAGLSHQLLVMENGVTKTAIGTGIWTAGNLIFGAANPTISASSYFIAPGGAYFNSGTVYTEAQFQCRGGIHDDNHADLTIAGGTSGTTYFSGSISGMSGYYPANNMIRLTPNLHLNSNAGNAVILNWDNGTTGNTSTLRIGNGASSDVFQVWATGNTGINITPSANNKLIAYDIDYTAGTSYDRYGARAVVAGADINVQSYEFGTAGYAWNDYTRCGGIIGAQWSASYWGSLGYKGSNSVGYGVYGSTNYSAGGGFMQNGNIFGIGIAGYGGIMGGWAKGDVLGFSTSGELYALYNDGNSYTEGYSADIVKTEDGRKAAYSVTSTSLKVYDDGSYEITGNEIFVSFNKDFASMINTEQNPTITVSPVGAWAPLYIKEIRKDGFVVGNDNYNGNNVKFSWIAVADRIDSESAVLPKDIADDNFNENLKGVMFNENITNRNATPIWWDGSSLRFDKIPEKPIDEAAKKAEEERMKQK